MPSEWPRRYTSAELEAIAKSFGRKELGRVTVHKLQKAVEAFQWACVFDDGCLPSSTKLGRRQRLKNIISLCQQEAPTEEIEVVLNELDGPTSRLLGPVNSTDLQAVQTAAEVALKKIPISGSDRKRAERQFIEELARIYRRVRGKFPGRRVQIRDYAPDNASTEQEYGPFRELVIAALVPFEPIEDNKRQRRRRDADIKAALNWLKAR